MCTAVPPRARAGNSRCAYDALARLGVKKKIVGKRSSADYGFVRIADCVRTSSGHGMQDYGLFQGPLELATLQQSKTTLVECLAN